mmetsp:Transcript_38463/g.96765  ORF Transcript_38463/g.96765 Transcript_38463/m.96765 type:complete len:210 (+) Transcript_38463:250-879(+)
MSAATSSPLVVVRPYEPRDREVVVRLFREGLLNLPFPDVAADGYRNYVEKSLREDMGDIEGYYTRGHRVFLVAEYGGVVCGTVALDHYEGRSDGSSTPDEDRMWAHDIAEGEKVAELRRMSVDANFRRKGIATALLAAFFQECKQWNYDAIVFTTSEYQYAAIAFYERWGFVKVKENVRLLDDEGKFKLHIPYYRLNMADVNCPTTHSS